MIGEEGIHRAITRFGHLQSDFIDGQPGIHADLNDADAFFRERSIQDALNALHSLNGFRETGIGPRGKFQLPTGLEADHVRVVETDRQKMRGIIGLVIISPD